MKTNNYPLSIAKDTLKTWKEANPQAPSEQLVADAFIRAIGYGIAGGALVYTGASITIPIAAASFVLGAANALSAFNVYNHLIAKQLQ